MTSTSTSYFASATVASAATVVPPGSATAAPAAAFQEPERGVKWKEGEGVWNQQRETQRRKPHPPPIFAWDTSCCISLRNGNVPSHRCPCSCGRLSAPALGQGLIKIGLCFAAACFMFGPIVAVLQLVILLDIPDQHQPHARVVGY